MLFVNKTDKSLLIKRFLCLLCLSVLIFSLTGCFGDSKQAGRGDGQPIYIKVEPGMTGESICNLLIQKGVISSPTKFKIYAKLKGAASKFQTGTYECYPNMDMGKVLDILTSGKTTTVHFTIPEGYTINEIAERLDKMGIIKADKLKQEAKNFAPYGYITDIPQAKYRVEGFLFPDTYEASPDASAKDILQIMADNFDSRLTPEMRAKAAAKGMSIHELVTLASLVEKEAGTDEERPIIAQIFLKRLEIFQPLESCASIQYLLDAPKEDLLIADTKIDSPYNTYQNYGLPPGPVANPGLKSLQAVLEPANTDYLYFVADHQGHNHFSATYAEHLTEVDKYR